jgi:YD repeat-containing protein
VAAKSYQEFLVRVPTEKDQPTTAVRVVFPVGFELLRVKPVPGWKYELERDATGRITAITWSGGHIGRTEYEVFSFMARAADPGTFQLNAFQTYGEHDIVEWVNAAEPRPAPKVTAVAPAATTAAPAVDPFASSAPAPAAPAAVRTSVLGTSGVMVAGFALAVSFAALALSRRTSR